MATDSHIGDANLTFYHNPSIGFFTLTTEKREKRTLHQISKAAETQWEPSFLLVEIRFFLAVPTSPPHATEPRNRRTRNPSVRHLAITYSFLASEQFPTSLLVVLLLMGPGSEISEGFENGFWRGVEDAGIYVDLGGGLRLHHYRDCLSFGRALPPLPWKELMLLGFISLLLTVSQSFISHICIPESASFHMLPCNKEGPAPVEVIHHRISSEIMWKRERLLSEDIASDHCTSQGKVQLLSLEALHQLHIFIFVLAVVHVVFCATTMVLGGARIRQWKNWEKEIHREISSPEKKIVKTTSTDHQRLSQPHHEFLQERAAGFWRKSPVVSRMMCFFKQFYGSLTKSDYKALRSGFIMSHCPTHPKFDFHKYMIRALEDDFKKVVGISWYLWLFVIIFLLINIHGWHAYFWLSFLPLILVLMVGAKLEHIITRLALKLAEMPPDGQGSRVKPSDEHFWFKWPSFVLYLIHFILFQNSFEIAFLFWIIGTYGFHSCILESAAYIIPRIIVGVIVQVLSSYITLPLYAIVTQMGDSYKQAIFAQHMQATLHGWVAAVRKRKRPGSGHSSTVMRMFGRKKKRPESSGNVTEVQRKMRAEEALSENDEIPSNELQIRTV